MSFSNANLLIQALRGWSLRPVVATPSPDFNPELIDADSPSLNFNPELVDFVCSKWRVQMGARNNRQYGVKNDRSLLRSHCFCWLFEGVTWSHPLNESAATLNHHLLITFRTSTPSLVSIRTK